MPSYSADHLPSQNGLPRSSARPSTSASSSAGRAQNRLTIGTPRENLPSSDDEDLLPYPIEPSTPYAHPSRLTTPGRRAQNTAEDERRTGVPPAPPSPVDFNDFVHLSSPIRPTAPTSLKNLAKKLLPRSRSSTAQDFADRALLARQNDIARSRTLKAAERSIQRVGEYRREELASEPGRQEGYSFEHAGRGERGRRELAQMIRAQLEDASLHANDRRSRSPRPRSKETQLEAQQFSSPPPSCRPLSPRVNSLPPTSYSQSVSPLLSRSRSTQSSTDRFPGHFHIESERSSERPAVDNQHPTAYHFKTSYDLRDRTVYMRKRDMLAHPVEALREGRVRRGEEVFGSEQESGAGSATSSPRITPFLGGLPHFRADDEVPASTPTLSRGSSSDPLSSVYPSERSTRPSPISWAEQLGKLVDEKEETKMKETWVRIKDKTVDVFDEHLRRHRSPTAEESRWRESARNSERSITVHGSGSPISRFSSSQSIPISASRPPLPRNARTFPAPPPVWERRHSSPRSYSSLSSLIDSQTDCHLACSPLERLIKVQTPKPLARTSRSPTAALSVLEEDDADAWEFVPSPIREEHLQGKRMGIGGLDMDLSEREKRGKGGEEGGKWVEWRKRADWKQRAKKKKDGKEERKLRFKRRETDFVYDY